MTVAALLEARAADPSPGLVVAGDGRTWSWAEVVEACRTRAAWLDARPRPADRPPHLGVLLDNEPDLPFLIGGAALSGAVVVALNPTRTPAELAADARRADCDLVLASPAHEERARALTAAADLPLLTLADHHAELDALPGSPAPAAARPEPVESDLVMLIFTSGTSGAPRAVRITHRKLTVPGEVLAERMLGPDDVVYCPMPLFHSGALMAAFAPALCSGATLVLRSRFSASGFLADIRDHGCTYTHYVGKALSYVLAVPERDDDAQNPLRFAFGNEAAPNEQAGFGHRFGCFVIDAYGSTETAISVTPDPTAPPGALGRLGDDVRILDPDGVPCPPAILDERGRLTNPEAVGELVGTGAGLFDGYYNDDAPDRWRDGAFWSGDLAYADAGGAVFFAGRATDRLRVDGENFSAVQVERALAQLPGVRRLAVYGVPDAASGDQVMVALAADSFDPESFAAHVRGEAVADKWRPRFVRISADLPTTASNKILKRTLAAEGWHTADPVWWRRGRDPDYRPLTEEDRARLRADFTERGRAHLLPDR